MAPADTAPSGPAVHVEGGALTELHLLELAPELVRGHADHGHGHSH